MVFKLSVYKLMPCTDRDSFTSSLPFYMTFISFSHLIALTGTSSTTSYRNYESRQACRAPGLREQRSVSPLGTLIVNFL